MIKPLPEVTESLRELYAHVYGPVRAKLLMTGIELGVFGQLASPTSASNVAQKLDTHPGNTEILLDGLASIDLITKREGLYRNGDVAQAFLVDGTETYVGGVLQFMDAISSFGVEHMADLVRQGPPEQPSDEALAEETWANYARIGANGQRAGSAQRGVKLIKELPEFPHFRKMLDLGGGAGMFAIAMVSAHPKMSGIVFDRPMIAEVARELIAEYGAGDRVKAIGGNYMSDPIGKDYDLIWSSATLNFAKYDIDPLMRKIHAALRPGGVFVSMHDGLTHEGTKPMEMFIGMVPLSLSGGPRMSFEQGFLADAMQRAGFESIQSRTLESPWGNMDLDIARKRKSPLDG